MSILTGDCVALMASLEEGSVDAIVTDPPYGLEFMGMAWDQFDGRPNGTSRPRNEWGDFGSREHARGQGDAYRVARKKAAALQQFSEQWAAAAFRVAKPGAYLLAFGGTRTYHRLAVAIEDANWVIRDCLVWAYASGFPKSRALLKPAWEPIVMARKPGPLRELAIDACRIGTTDDLNGGGYGGPLRDPDPSSYGLRRGIGEFVQPAGRWPANVILTDPIFDGGVEGVVGGGIASAGGAPADVRGRGGIWHEGDGIPAGPQYGDSGTYSRFFLIPKADRTDREPVLRGSLTPVDVPNYQPTVLVCQCGERWKPPENGGLLRCNHPREMYHYEAAPRDPQQRENAHPTVKPTELMRHLVRLVTPQGGTVLDPFAGSGSTLIAAEQEGFPWIGMEREPEYVAIAEARLNGTQRGFGLPT